MREKVSCPTCGWTWRKPIGPSVRTALWSDQCACSDVGTCVAHQLDPTTAPGRPPYAILAVKAAEDYAAKVEAWAKKAEEIKKVTEKEPGCTCTKWKAEDGSMWHDPECLVNELAFAQSEVRHLSAKLQDWESSAKDAALERHPDMEVHCTCVPLLRKEVERLKKELAQAQNFSNEIDDMRMEEIERGIAAETDRDVFAEEAKEWRETAHQMKLERDLFKEAYEKLLKSQGCPPKT